MKKALELLKLVTDTFDFSDMGGEFKGSHSLTLHRDHPGMTLNIWTRGMSYPVHLDEADLEKSAEDLLREITPMIGGAQ